MATDFNRIRQLVTALIDIQSMQEAFAQPGAQAPSISISFPVIHPQVGTAPTLGDANTPPAPASADYKPAWTEQFSFNFSLPADVAGSAAVALASAVMSAMSAMQLPTI